MNADLDLDAIKARYEAATEGPWDRCNTSVDASGPGRIAAHVDQPDAEFIAYARTDVPALVAEVERLRSRINGLLLDLDRPEEDEAYAAEVNDGYALALVVTERRIAARLRNLLAGDR